MHEVYRYIPPSFVQFIPVYAGLAPVINTRRSTEFNPGTIMKLLDAIWMMGSAVTFIMMTDTATGKYVFNINFIKI